MQICDIAWKGHICGNAQLLTKSLKTRDFLILPLTCQDELSRGDALFKQGEGSEKEFLAFIFMEGGRIKNYRGTCYGYLRLNLRGDIANRADFAFIFEHFARNLDIFAQQDLNCHTPPQRPLDFRIANPAARLKGARRINMELLDNRRWERRRECRVKIANLVRPCGDDELGFCREEGLFERGSCEGNTRDAYAAIHLARECRAFAC